MPTTLKADPHVRRKAVLALLCGVAAAVATYSAIEAWLIGLEALPREQARWKAASALRVGSWAILFSVAAFAVYIWLLGHRTRRAAQFPPPGTKVWRDTTVVEGQPARARALLLQSIAVLLVLFGSALVVVAHQLTIRVVTSAA
jgi:hypothetical protein